MIGSTAFPKKLPSDQHAPDLASAGADFIEFRVAQQAAGGIVVDVAIAAEQLNRIQRQFCRLFRRV